MKDSVVNGLNDVVTRAQFLDYISSPEVAPTMPTEIDARQHLDRLYGDGAPNLNWCRSLDELQAVRTVSRNYGEMRTFSGNETGGGKDFVVLGLPSPAVLFDKVWGLVPSFIKDKIAGWARNGLEGAIAKQLTEYVKRGLALLPLPIPSFFLNSVTNLVIPPLVRFVISKLNPQSASRKGTDFGMPNYVIFARHTAKSLELMKEFDRRILLAAGLKSSELPPQLMETPNDNAPGDGGFVLVGPGEVSPNMGQPDDRDSRAAIQQFFENETPNGFKPLPLIQVIAAQQRTNGQSDEDSNLFGMRVWEVLTPEVQRKVRDYALHDPPAKARIVDEIYTSTRGLLGRNPYLVPGPIIDSFASMKVPEVVEWAVRYARG